MSIALSKGDHTSIRNTGRSVAEAAKRLETEALTPGRKGRKLSPEVKMQLVKLVAAGRGFTKSCNVLGFSHAAALQESRKDKVFGMLLDEARVHVKEGLEESMVDRAMKNDTTAGIFMLKAMDPEVYGEKLSIDARHRFEIAVSLIPAEALLGATGAVFEDPGVIDAEEV